MKNPQTEGFRTLPALTQQSMIMNSQFLRLICTISALVTPLHAEYREWSNTEGVKIDAELVKAEDQNVTLRLRNGKLSTFPQSKLSPSDIDFLKENKSAQPTEPESSVNPSRKAKWLSQMDKAEQESKETGLPILVLFTGTSWCPYCIKLEKAVFSQKDFESFASQNLVLLMLDFEPGGETKNKKNKQLQKDFGVSGFPTYFLTDSTGKQLAKGGYHDGITPASFADWVKQSAPKK